MNPLKLFRRPVAPVNLPPSDDKLLASLLVLAWVVEARDPYTGGHLWRVSRLSKLLAAECGEPGPEAVRIGIGGFLHDLGKVGVPDHILRKPGRLDDAEYAVIKTHPEAGRRMLSGHPLAHLVEDMVHMHHETPDGTGYPQGLKGNAIPIAARIVGICDAFDAMTSHRPYRQGMPVEKALGIIRQNLGKQFDAAAGERFLALGESAKVTHIVGHTDEGIPLRRCVSCGPTLVVRREHAEGAHIHCPACTGEYVLRDGDDGLVPVPTGRQGRAADVLTQPDLALISRLIAVQT